MSKKHLDSLLAYIDFCYPEAFATIKEKNLINPNLFSPFVLDIPQSVYTTIENFVSKIYAIKESEAYLSKLDKPDDFSSWPDTKSLLTCFDLHYSDEQGLKLIEINTNASLYLPIVLQRCAQADHCVPPQFTDLLDSFKKTFDLKQGDPISVFDKTPEGEGLFFEFLIFKEWLGKKGYPTNIVSLDSFPTQSNKYIYNRYTDFYFENPESKTLKEQYISGEKVFSPNPKEYFLLADKKRLSVLREFLAEDNADLAKIIPVTKLFKDFDSKDHLWSERKKYFLKPSASFGSKGAFSGKGISRKAFENLYDPDFIAQEFCPAGRKKFEYDSETIEMKYDLRFFTFEGKIQNYGARLYQGQTTNMRTPLGGIAPIRFI